MKIIRELLHNPLKLVGFQLQFLIKNDGPDLTLQRLHFLFWLCKAIIIQDTAPFLDDIAGAGGRFATAFSQIIV